MSAFGNRMICPALNWIPAHAPPDLFSSALAHFQGVPWTASLLSKPDVIPFIPNCRNPSSPDLDQFLGNTLRTDNALRHMLCFFEKDEHFADPNKPITKLTTLFSLGPGLSGVPHVLHGGMTMSMADEAMGALTELNAELAKQGEAFQTGSVTGTLEIKFLRAIPVGTDIVATAWIESVERRKTTIKCEFRDEDGEELARCQSIWVAVKSNL
ncbi:unnamed protein product [Clonostachys rosea f. rosea IK726]|uniref:Thioesterase domain-containing protein n=2 Tax=Bionectria ochroleuca TaxID=29856 RepID=A0A0B7K1C0_BIOOC|nr:unnamed protein product [Clonostachys rosea f. rosea IK726]